MATVIDKVWCDVRGSDSGESHEGCRVQELWQEEVLISLYTCTCTVDNIRIISSILLVCLIV